MATIFILVLVVGLVARIGFKAVGRNPGHSSNPLATGR